MTGIKYLISGFAVLALSTAVSAQVLTPDGAPNGGERSIHFGGGVAHLNLMVPTENLTTYSMSFWLSPDQLSSESFFLGQTDQGIHLGLRDSGKLHQAHWGSDHSGVTTVPNGSPLDANNWVHAFYTYDATTSEAKIYYNGVNDDGGGVMKNTPNQSGPETFLILGGRNGGDSGFTGQIDDVAFWDTVVSDADIAAIADGTSPTAIDTPAQLYWDFEEANSGINEFGDVSIRSSSTGDGIWDVPADHSFSLPSVPIPGERAQPLGTGNWHTRIVHLDTSGTDGQVNDTAEARAILRFADGGENTNGWTILSDHSDFRNRIDMAGNGGVAFPHNHPYPDGTNDASTSDFVVSAASADSFYFPEGTYALAFGSDDGGEIILTDIAGNPVNFTAGTQFNVDGDTADGDNIITYNSPRGNGTTCGEFTVPPGGQDIHVDAIMFERGGGDSFEIGISDGICRNMVNGFFVTLAGQDEFGIIGNGGPPPPGKACDLDGDGDCDPTDLGLLYDNGANELQIAEWLTQASDDRNPYKADVSDIYVVGDANLDGDVNSADLGLLLNNFNTTEDDNPAAGTWRGGDLNNSGSVDSVDLGQLLNNFGATSPATVPEPSGFILLGLGMLGLAIGRARAKTASI